MTLEQWRKDQGLDRAQLARKLGVSMGAIETWEYGTRIPARRMMVEIIALTGGDVLPNDFYKAAIPTKCWVSHESPADRRAVVQTPREREPGATPGAPAQYGSMK